MQDENLNPRLMETIGISTAEQEAEIKEFRERAIEAIRESESKQAKSKKLSTAA
jgi:hypothetical protein